MTDEGAANQVEHEWTHVSRKNRRLYHTAKVTKETLGAYINRDPQLSLDEQQRFFASADADWRASEACKKLQKLLLENTARHAPITSAICLGPGVFEPLNESYSGRRTAHMQVAAFRWLTETLASLNSHPIRRIIQEPGFSRVDKDLCAVLELEVVESPAAFSMINSSTLVYGIHLESPIVYEALAAGTPALFVGTPLASWEPLAGRNDDVQRLIARMAGMDATCDRYPFPDLENPRYIFHDTCLYWRRRNAIDE